MISLSGDTKAIFSDVELAAETELLRDLMSGERVHMSFDVPKKLRHAFKLATRLNKQTMCPVLQDFIITYVAATRLRKACFNNTLQPVVNVENFVIPSYERLKFRRGDVKREDFTPCGFRGCEGEAVGKGVFVAKNREFLLCADHLKEAEDSCRSWRNIEVF